VASLSHLQLLVGRSDLDVQLRHPAAVAGRLERREPRLGVGRVVASEGEAPNLLVNLL
jgi:hypothetical protein